MPPCSIRHGVFSAWRRSCRKGGQIRRWCDHAKQKRTARSRAGDVHPCSFGFRLWTKARPGGDRRHDLHQRRHLHRRREAILGRRRPPCAMAASSRSVETRTYCRSRATPRVSSIWPAAWHCRDFTIHTCTLLRPGSRNCNARSTTCSTVEAILDAVAVCAGRNEDEWIVGSGWDLSLFENSSPRKELLDQAAPGRAVILWGADGHSAWASSRALERAGITAKTPNPENGKIEHDSRTGEPSGTLRETAIDLVMDEVPSPSPETRLEGLKRGLKHVSEVGITSFIEASVGDADFDAFKSVAKSGELSAKVRLSLTYGMFGSDGFEALLARRNEASGPRLNADAIKIFIDGVLEGETAALLSPYLTRPGYSGSITMPADELNAAVTQVRRDGPAGAHARHRRCSGTRRPGRVRGGAREERREGQPAPHLAPAADRCGGHPALQGARCDGQLPVILGLAGRLHPEAQHAAGRG